MPKQSRASLAQENMTRAAIAAPKPVDAAPVKHGRAILDAMQAGNHALAAQLRAEQKRANKRRAKDKKARRVAESGIALQKIVVVSMVAQWMPTGGGGYAKTYSAKTSKQDIARPLHRARITDHDAIKSRGMLGADPLAREAIGLNDNSKSRETIKAKRAGMVDAMKTRLAYDKARCKKKDTD